MNDPLMLLEVAKARCQDCAREAQVDYLTRRTTVTTPRARARLLLKIADVMILSGVALRTRYEPATR